MNEYQIAVFRWMRRCFGERITMDLTERNFRFLEEALELVQAAGCSKLEALELVEYVFNRPAGEAQQEVGGVMVCLAALCTVMSIDPDMAGAIEIGRCEAKTNLIREKHKAKPAHIKGPSGR
jgi:hypothetical protein